MSEPKTPGFEATDADPRHLATIAAVLVVVVAGVAGSLLVGFRTSIEDRGKGPGATLPPSPRLQADAIPATAELRRRADERLKHGGITDADRGRAHIPISDAIGIVVARGLPGWTVVTP